MAEKRKSLPLCEPPRSGFFCGTDKYLLLQEHTISAETPPIMELDSYFILVRSGRGSLIINGEEFSIEPDCIAWIQCSQVVTISPDFGDQLQLWVCPFDYQLLSYYMFSELSSSSEREIVNGTPVVGPQGQNIERIKRLFSQYKRLCEMKGHGSAVIRSSFLRKIELLFNRETHERKSSYEFSSMPLARQASLYIATHSHQQISAADVAKAVGNNTSEAAVNHALLVATGFNFNQFLSRMRVVLSTSYFLYDGLPLDYICSISGFNMEITFFRRFKALFGTTPQNYAKRMMSDGSDGRVYRGMIMNETLISAISYLYENMTEHIDADTLARNLYTSENILRVQFKDRLDSSFKQILSQFRVRYAEALLATTELPTVDIAIESGFGSDRTMGRVFYNINGVSPGEFRRTRSQRSNSNG